MSALNIRSWTQPLNGPPGGLQGGIPRAQELGPTATPPTAANGVITAGSWMRISQLSMEISYLWRFEMLVDGAPMLPARG